MPVSVKKDKNGLNVLCVVNPTRLDTVRKVAHILHECRPDKAILEINTKATHKKDLANVFKRLGTICEMIYDSGMPLQLTKKMVVKARGSRPVLK